MHETGVSPGLTVALALAAGIIAQSLARHARLPGIVILLAVGVLMGPDGLGVLDPDSLGGALGILVEFAVAVILFEGGMNLDWRRLRRQGATIRRLVTLGALVSAVGGALVARLLLGWDWRLSILFGTLVVVTGPTVVTPLLRRIKVKRNLETILEAEGVFIDAVGAILAVVALEIVLSPTGSSLAIGFISIPSALLTGAALGLAGGVIMALLLRSRGVVPEGLENVFTLALALALFQISNHVMAETGIMAVITAGLVLGNVKTHVQRELKEFKEQLTVMLIGMLFVLLAADVRLVDIQMLGARGVWVVVALIFLVRPLNVIVCTLRSGMNWREKSFLSWLAPRGIVAAAISSLFHERLADVGYAGGDELRALVFLVIAITVVFEGTTGGWVAKLLGVRRPSGQGYAILGAHELARTVARLLGKSSDVVLLDANAEICGDAEKDGFKVVFGNALEERALLSAELESRSGALGILPNEAVSLLFARKARGEYKVKKTFVAIQRGHGSINRDMIHHAGAHVLFSEEADLDLWSVRIRRGVAIVEEWRKESVSTDEGKDGLDKVRLPKEMGNLLLPLTITNGTEVAPLHDGTKADLGSSVHWLVLDERKEQSHKWLKEDGWVLLPEPEPVPPE